MLQAASDGYVSRLYKIHSTSLQNIPTNFSNSYCYFYKAIKTTFFNMIVFIFFLKNQPLSRKIGINCVT